MQTDLNEERSSLLEQRKEQVEQLNRLNVQFSNSKWGKRGGIKKAIRNVEQSISKLDRSLKNTVVSNMRETGFNYGIDTRGNQVASVSSATASIASSIASAYTGGASSSSGGFFGGSSVSRPDGSKSSLPSITSVNPMIIIGALIGVYLLFFNKK